MALLQDLATMKLLNEGEPGMKPRIIIFHTMVGGLKACENFFRSSSNLESHFGVGGSTDGDLDGVIWQFVDTAQTADANFKANAFAISIETSDGGDPGRPWSPKQVDALVRLTRRLSALHDIPLRVVTSWNDPVGGLGWHTMFGAPGKWTPVAKNCPGPVRIAQLKNEIFPALGIGAAAQGPVIDPGPGGFPGVLLKRGSQGEHVCRVQARLRALGHHVAEVPGCPFGPQTETAVKAFQGQHNLTADGKVGKDTWTALFAT